MMESIKGFRGKAIKHKKKPLNFSKNAIFVNVIMDMVVSAV